MGCRTDCLGLHKRRCNSHGAWDHPARSVSADRAHTGSQAGNRAGCSQSFLGMSSLVNSKP